MRKAVVTSDASIGDGPYSQAIISKGSLFVSGQGPLDPQTGEILGSEIEDQTRFTMNNILNILKAAHCSLDDVLKVTVILADIGLFDRFNAVYQTYFVHPYPARTCFSGGLGEILVEIEVIAEIEGEVTR